MSGRVMRDSTPTSKEALGDLLFYEPLTWRERQVLQGCALGWTARETATRLGIASETVKFHKGGVLRKFRESETTMHRVLAECWRTGYLDPADRRLP